VYFLFGLLWRYSFLLVLASPRKCGLAANGAARVVVSRGRHSRHSSRWLLFFGFGFSLLFKLGRERVGAPVVARICHPTDRAGLKTKTVN